MRGLGRDVLILYLAWWTCLCCIGGDQEKSLVSFGGQRVRVFSGMELQIARRSLCFADLYDSILHPFAPARLPEFTDCR